MNLMWYVRCLATFGVVFQIVAVLRMTMYGNVMLLVPLMYLQVIGGKFKEYFDLAGKIGGEVAQHVSWFGMS